MGMPGPLDHLRLEGEASTIGDCGGVAYCPAETEGNRQDRGRNNAGSRQEQTTNLERSLTIYKQPPIRNAFPLGASASIPRPRLLRSFSSPQAGSREEQKTSFERDTSINERLPIRVASPPAASASNKPLCFFNLPQELQERVYEHYYMHKSDIRVRLVVDDPTRCRPRLEFIGLPRKDLELACRKIWRDTQRSRRDIFSGQMYIDYDPMFGFDALYQLCAKPSCRWMRDRVSKLWFTGLCRSPMLDRHRQTNQWQDLFANFPAVKEIKLDCMEVWYATARKGAQMLHWRTYADYAFNPMFNTGLQDLTYAYLVEDFCAPELARMARQLRPDCEIHARSSMQWRCRQFEGTNENVGLGSMTRAMLTMAQWVEFRVHHSGRIETVLRWSYFFT